MVMELGVYLANKLNSFHSQDIYNLEPPLTVPEEYLSSVYLGVERIYQRHQPILQEN